ncbi:MAG: hypothetical protein WCI88_01830 [Chloroflexota bacterium]
MNPLKRFRFSKDRGFDNKLQDNIDEVVKSAEKTMVSQNNLAADFRQ